MPNYLDRNGNCYKWWQRHQKLRWCAVHSFWQLQWMHRMSSSRHLNAYVITFMRLLLPYCCCCCCCHCVVVVIIVVTRCEHTLHVNKCWFWWNGQPDRYGPHFEDIPTVGNVTNITVPIGNAVYLNCRISLLQDKTVRIYMCHELLFRFLFSYFILFACNSHTNTHNSRFNVYFVNLVQTFMVVFHFFECIFPYCIFA